MKVIPKINSETIIINEVSIHCQWINQWNPEKSKPVLVFLHEGLGSIGQWKDFPALLSEKLKLPALVYDRYGYGKSSRLRSKRKTDYLHAEALDFLPKIVHHFKLKDMILIGHSDGGSIALIYAAKHPSFVKALVTEAAHVFVEEISLINIEKAKHNYETNARFKSALEKYHGDKTDSVLYNFANTITSEAFRNWNIENFLPKIKCPVLAIQGENDQYGTKDQVDSIVNKVAIGEGLMIPNCKHVPHLETKTLVADAIINFLQKHAVYEKQ